MTCENAVNAMVLEYKLVPECFFPISADKLFSDLTEKSRASLALIKQTKQFCQGENFFSAGDTARRFFVLCEGEARLRFRDRRNEITIVRSIKRNEIVGLTETIADLPYETQAESVTFCRCECIRREDFIRFLRDEPEIGLRLVRMLGLSLQKTCKIICSSIN